MKRILTVTLVLITGCATVAWAANNFGNTTITGTLTVVGSIVSDAISGLESIELENDSDTAEISMDGVAEPEGELPSATEINAIGRGPSNAALDDNVSIFSIKTQYWDGDSLEDGHLLAFGKDATLIGAPDFSSALSIGGGAVSIAGAVTASNSLTAASLATSDGGLVLEKQSGSVILAPDGRKDGTGDAALIEAFSIEPKKNGVLGSWPIEYYQQNDGMGGVDEAYWAIGGENFFKVNKSDGLVTAPNFAFGDAIGTGNVAAPGSYAQTFFATDDGTTGGTVNAFIDGANGQVDASDYIEGAAFRRSDAETVTAAASVTFNCASRDVFDVTADRNITINPPTGAADVQEIIVRWKQDGTGGWSPTWNGVFKFGNHTSTPTATANNTTIWRFIKNGSNWQCLGVTTGIS